MANILSREAILAARLRSEVVEVPEWGGSVYVWELSALRKFELRPAEGEAPELSLARLVAACVGDEEGPMGLPAENVGAPAFARLLQAVTRLNIASAESAEEIRKNSEGGPTGDSPSGSP